MNTTLRIWISRLPNLIAAAILAQTLFFKFTAAPESVHIFSTLGIEPVGRIGSGIAELVAAVLLLWPAFAWVGAGIALGVMTGAIASHLMVLGIEVQGDGGLLFSLAVVVAALSTFILVRERERIRTIIKNTLNKRDPHNA